MKHALRFTLLGLAVCLVAVACGGSDNEAADTTSTTPTATYRVDQVVRAFRGVGVNLQRVRGDAHLLGCDLLTGSIDLRALVSVCKSDLAVGPVVTAELVPLNAPPSRSRRTFIKQNVRVDYSGPIPGYGTRGGDIAKIEQALGSLRPG
jgi:hypothetical protein